MVVVGVKKIKKLLPIIGGVLFMGALVFVILPKFFGGPLQINVGGAQAAATTVVQVKTVEVPAQPDRGIPVTLGERVVNLADPGGFRYLKVEIVLGLSEEGKDTSKLTADKITAEQTRLGTELGPLKPQIQDVVTTVLTSKTVADLSTAEGKDAVKAELSEKLQPLLKDQKIAGVYFAQFLIQ